MKCPHAHTTENPDESEKMHTRVFMCIKPDLEVKLDYVVCLSKLKTHKTSSISSKSIKPTLRYETINIALHNNPPIHPHASFTSNQIICSCNPPASRSVPLKECNWNVDTPPRCCDLFISFLVRCRLLGSGSAVVRALSAVSSTQEVFWSDMCHYAKHVCWNGCRKQARRRQLMLM